MAYQDFAFMLHKRSFLLENGERLLEALDLQGTSPFLLLVWMKEHAIPDSMAAIAKKGQYCLLTILFFSALLRVQKQLRSIGLHEALCHFLFKRSHSFLERIFSAAHAWSGLSIAKEGQYCLLIILIPDLLF